MDNQEEKDLTALLARNKPPRSSKIIIIGMVLGLLIFVFYAGYQKGRYGATMTETSVAPQEAVFFEY